MKATAVMIGAVLGLLVVTGVVEALARVEWIGFAAVLLIISSLVAVVAVAAVSLFGLIVDER